MNKPDNTGMVTNPQSSADLLIELGCEELPPKSLTKLGEAFFSEFLNQLKKAELSFNADKSQSCQTLGR